MKLSLDQLEIFVAAATCRSFSETGRRLHKAQSAVSKAIGDLELELGIQLFERSGRYPSLTPAGQALVAEAEAVLLHCGSIKDRASALTGHVEPEVRLAIEDAFPCGEAAAVFQAFRSRFPNVRLDLLQPAEDGLVDMVLAGAAQLGLGCARANYPMGIAFTRLGSVTLANVVGRAHPLAGETRVRFAALADHLQLVLHSQTRHLLTAEYLKAPRQWRIQSPVALLDLLRQGLGWAIVPRRLVAAELASGELVELTLEAYPHTRWTIGLDLMWKTEARPGIAAASLKADLAGTRVFA